MSNPTSYFREPGVPMAAVTAGISDLAGGNPAMAEIVLSNCTTTLPLKFEFHEGDVSHSFVIGKTRNVMSVMSELLTNEQLRHGGQLVVVIDKESSMDQLGEQK